MAEELIEKFKTLSDEDKLNFFKAVMPCLIKIIDCNDTFPASDIMILSTGE